MKKISLDTLTGEQFKELIEQFTDDGKLNTIPELLQRIGEVPDDMTLEDYIKEKAEQSAVSEDTVRKVVDEQLEETSAEHGDIDEIFENE
jgi:polyhydroxyalkanoate synthesis regulator phasin